MHGRLRPRGASQQTPSALSAGARSATGRQHRLSQLPRHQGLFDAVHQIDARIDEASRQELVGWISDQYRTEHGDVPLGFLARCYLGVPYVDHRLDLLRSIAEHFSPSDSVPSPFDGARGLVRFGAYEFVEVYASGALVPVRADGTVDAPVGGQ